MKWYYKIGILILLVILAYLVGNWIPIAYLKPTVTPKNLESPEYYSLIIGILSAFATFLAVVAALFKDDLRKYWVYSKFKIDFEDSNKLIEMLEVENSETTSESGSNHYKAAKYECILNIENIGNKTAKNCELYIEKLSFSGEGFPETQSIKINTSSLTWDGESDKKIIIPQEGKKSVRILELLEPKNQSLPDGRSKQKNSELIIGGVKCPIEYRKGNWEANIIVYADDSKPYKFVLELNWNGKWEQRFSEMNKCLKINLKN